MRGPKVRTLPIALTLASFLAISGSASAEKQPLPESTAAEAAHGSTAPAWRMLDAGLPPAASQGPAAEQDGGNGPANAVLISAPVFRDLGSTNSKSNNASMPSCNDGGSETSPDSWYKVTLPQGGLISAWTCTSTGREFDTRIGILNTSLSVLACNDDSPSCGLQSRITDFSVGAGTYYIVVDGYNGTSGSYELNVRWQGPVACSGSNAANAQVISSLPFTETRNLANDCDDYLVTCELGGNQGGPDHFYKVTLNAPVMMDVSTVCNAAHIDTRIAILDLDQNKLYCSDNAPSCPTGQSAIVGALLSAGTYYLVIDSANLTGGSYQVQVSTTPAPPGSIVDLVPDILTRTNELYDYDIVTNISPGRTHLRLSNATANIGLGKLDLYGVFPVNGDGTQNVHQRVWRTDGTHFDHDAGAFVYHASHSHIHFEDWAIYRLRTVAAGGGVGGIVVEGSKTSFCILDLLVHDSTLPGYPSSPEFGSCGSSKQGLSVGWADVYDKTLVGQNLDITGVAAGQYWLESEVDPLDHVLETDETNNVARILVTIGNPGPINPDPYEPNNQISDLTSRPVGGPNSPVLGPCGPLKEISGLTIHAGANDDYFRFYMPATGGNADELRIDFPNAAGNLELALLNNAGSTLATSSSSSRSFERIALKDFPAGWYYGRVYGVSGATSPGYALTVNPSQNGAPGITVVNPPTGDTRVPEIGSYTMTWTSSDPEANETWVDVFVNTTPALNGNEIFLPTSQNTPGAQGSYIINPAYVPEGTYYVYARITDGGTVSGDWSTGTITIVPVTAVEGSSAPLPWRLLPTSPNPFNPNTTLRLQMPHEARVSWRIHDARGALVRTLVQGSLPAGLHTRTWDGRNEQGRDVASGTYYLIVEAEDYTGRQKLTLLR